VHATQVLAIQLAFNVVALSLIARWYVVPRLAAMPRDRALVPLLCVHFIRLISMWTTVPGVIVSPDMPQDWARSTAIGDAVAVALALAAITLLRRGARSAIAVVWVFNVAGLLDAIKNGVLAARMGVPEHMGAAVIIPAYGVPFLVVSHGLIFWLLRRKASGV
jgi:hypothetical protein